MKKWMISVFCLVSLLFIAYYSMGYIAKRTLEKHLEFFPKSSLFTVNLLPYQQGWFSSKTQISIKLDIPEQKIIEKNGITQIEPPIELEIKIPIGIKHGPFIINDHGIRFGIAELTTQPETHYQALINYFNETIIKFNSPAFALKDTNSSGKEDFQLQWYGLTALVRFSPNLNHINSRFKLYGLNSSASNLLFNLGELTYDLQLRRQQNWLWLGLSHLNIASLKVSAPGKQECMLDDFNFLAHANMADDALNLDLSLSLHQLIFNHQRYGPAVLRLSINNIEPDAMAKLNQQEARMMENNRDLNLRLLTLANQLPKLLAKGPIVELSKMEINLPEGKIIGTFKMWLPQKEINDLTQAVQNAHGEGHFQAPVAVVKSMMLALIKNELAKKIQPASQAFAEVGAIPATRSPDEEAQRQMELILKELINKEILKVEDSNYVLNFKIKNQQLLINGKLVNSNALP